MSSHAGNHCRANAGDQRLLAEFLSSMNVGKVYLHRSQTACRDAVSKGDASVRQSTWIYDQTHKAGIRPRGYLVD